MPNWPLVVRRAEPTALHFATIIGLIDEAAAWLGTKGTDQWAHPWPNKAGRDGRVRLSLAEGKTWICWDRDTPAATLTVDLDDDPHWVSAHSRPSRPAIYIHRFVVGRGYGGMRLGGCLLSWAGRTGRLAHGAHSVRVSAWTTNRALHRYYERQGFEPRGYHADDGYPSGARYEKLTSVIPFTWPPLFSAPSQLVSATSRLAVAPSRPVSARSRPAES
jgi:RimJ/RimL family protein N-acetyltransferase